MKKRYHALVFLLTVLGLTLATLLAPADASCQNTATVTLCAKHTSGTGGKWEDAGDQIEIGAQCWFYGGRELKEIREGSKKLAVKSASVTKGACQTMAFPFDPNQFTDVNAPKRITHYHLKLWENDCGSDSDYNTLACTNGDDLIHDKNQTFRGSLYSGSDYGAVEEVITPSPGGTRVFSAGFAGHRPYYYFDGGGSKNGTYVVVLVEVK